MELASRGFHRWHLLGIIEYYFGNTAIHYLVLGNGQIGDSVTISYIVGVTEKLRGCSNNEDYPS